MSDLEAALAHPGIRRLARTLASRRPVHADPPEPFRRAAVALLLRRAPDESLELLLIKRAEHAGDPWSGHIALPGGRQDPGDLTSLHTALRETMEEIGIDVEARGRVLGPLDELGPTTPRLPPLVISPHVAVVEYGLPMTLSHEVALAFWVPLERLRDPAASQEVDLDLATGMRRVTGLTYEEHLIWGLTERILRGFFALLDEPDIA